MQEYFLKLFAHEHWANQELLSALMQSPAVPERVMQLISHILTAHRFWDLRVNRKEIKQFDFWPPLNLEQCMELNEDYTTQRWPEYIRTLSEPLSEKVISFDGFDGQPREFRVIDILTQLHAHSVHHRAQIMLSMKAAGLSPVTTDYLLFCRLTESKA